MSNSEKGPARGKVAFAKYQSALVMVPKCHPAANFKLIFDAQTRAEGVLELHCSECGALFAAMRLGRD